MNVAYWKLRVNEGDHDVPCAGRGGEPLVVVGETARVHQHVALLRRLHRTVVPQEIAASALIIGI